MSIIGQEKGNTSFVADQETNKQRILFCSTHDQHSVWRQGGSTYAAQGPWKEISRSVRLHRHSRWKTCEVNLWLGWYCMTKEVLEDIEDFVRKILVSIGFMHLMLMKLLISSAVRRSRAVILLNCKTMTASICLISSKPLPFLLSIKRFS